jgi:integrase
MKQHKTGKTWEKTRLQGMVRHRNGGYYARTFANGREKWRSLRTSLFSVAEVRLAEHSRESREQKALTDSAEAGSLTFGEATQLYTARLDADPARKDATKHYHRQVIISILRDWPELKARPLKRITRRECADWAQRHAERASATRYNAALGIFRSILNLGIETGAIVVSPAHGLKRRPVRTKRAELPAREQFIAILDAIRSGGARYSRACADFVAGLAFTGMRLAEAHNLTWGDVDFTRRTIHVRGDVATGTKNWETRTVPLIADAEQLLRRMHAEYPDTARSTRVFLVGEAQKALDRAAAKVGVPRITHHALRHLFATICIESGVDIPTVSRWLGHKDGGALAMRVYGHLREEHSMAAARKVSFAPVVEAANVISIASAKAEAVAS